MEDSEKCRKYKAADKCGNLGREENLAIASSNNLNDSLNQRSEIFVGIGLVCFLVGKIWILLTLILFFLTVF